MDYGCQLVTSLIIGRRKIISNGPTCDSITVAFDDFAHDQLEKGRVRHHCNCRRVVQAVCHGRDSSKMLCKTLQNFIL